VDHSQRHHDEIPHSHSTTPSDKVFAFSIHQGTTGMDECTIISLLSNTQSQAYPLNEHTLLENGTTL